LVSRVLLFLCLFLPSVALGQAWQQNEACTRALTDNVLRAGGKVFYCFTGATDSTLLKIETTSAHVYFDGNIASEGVATATAYLRQCDGTKVDNKECPKVLVDLDGGGIGPTDDLPLNGDDGSTTKQRRAIYDIGRGNYYIDVVTSPGGQTARVVIIGN